MLTNLSFHPFEGSRLLCTCYWVVSKEQEGIKESEIFRIVDRVGVRVRV